MHIGDIFSFTYQHSHLISVFLFIVFFCISFTDDIIRDGSVNVFPNTLWVSFSGCDQGEGA